MVREKFEERGEILVRVGKARQAAVGNDPDHERGDWSEEVSNILIGSSLHKSIRDLAAKMIRAKNVSRRGGELPARSYAAIDRAARQAF